MLHTTETIAGTSTAAAGAAQGVRRGAVLAALCVLCGAAGAAHALPEAFYDFEGLDAGTVGPGGLSLTDNGLTTTFDRPFALLAIEDAPGATPASWGDRQLALLDSALVPPAPLFISFSEGVTGFSIELGGFEPGPYAVLLSVFGGANGTGSVIDSQVLSFDGALPVADTLAFSFLAPTDAIGSVSIDVSIPGGGSGGGAPDAFYFDNLTVIIPSPGGVVLLAGVGVLGARRRRR